jgi:YVTN family beta-propeller protein
MSSSGVHPRRLLPLLLPALLLLAACGDDNPTSAPPIVIPGPNEAIVYSKHIQPIFQNSCSGSGCHSGADIPSGYSFASWESVMEGTDDFGAEVIPFSAAKSHLFQHINTDTLLAPTASPRMPLGRDPLPREQILLIKRWIDEGAKNDNGEIALGDPARPRLLVTAQSEDKVTVIDLATERIARYIDVGSSSQIKPASPHNILYSPDHNFFYVNMIAGGTVEKYDAHTFAKLGSTGVGLAPAQIAVTHDGASLYVSNFDLSPAQQRFIVKINAATMTVTDTIFEVGRAPHGVVLSRDEKFLYTTNALGDDISIINLATGEVDRRIPISPGDPLAPGGVARFEPYQGELTADGRYFWVTCRQKGEVRVIDLVDGRVIDSITVGARPLIPKMTPDGAQLWVPNQGDNTLSVIDIASHKVIATIRDLKNQPHGVIFSADGSRAFVSCENQVGDGTQHHPTEGSSARPGMLYTIDRTTRAVTRETEIGSFAAGMTIGG